MIKGYLEYISKETDSYSSKYDNFLHIGDFNSEPTGEATKSFCQILSFKNLSDKPVFYINPNNPSCVNLSIINEPRRFQNSCKFKTGLSEFHEIILAVLISSFAKQKPRVPNNRNYKFFDNTPFRYQVLNKPRNSIYK